MEPFTLGPALKDYLWGGVRLREEYGKKTDLDPVAESWEVSTHPDGPSTITSGENKGMSLRDFIARHPGAMGTNSEGEEEFPILVKYIDAAQSLSIQVHPDEAYAQRVEHGHGKTEMWVILDAEPDSFIYYGFENPTTREEMERGLMDGDITGLLRKVPCKAGDVFFIPAGTVHAIGAGLLIAEIQQNSNSTYRVYDFGRKGPDGRLRPLHVEKALDVSVGEPVPEDTPGAGLLAHTEDYNAVRLASCPLFTTDRVAMHGFYSFTVNEKSFVAVLCVGGNASLECKDTRFTLAKGESAFLPADCGEVKMRGEADIILASK